MEAIKDYLKEIAGYLIISVLIENLTARKEYEPYIRLFLNLLLVFLFISPILTLSSQKIKDELIESTYVISADAYHKEDLMYLNEQQTTLEREKQLEILKQQLGILLEEKGFQLENIELSNDVYGNIMKLNVSVKYKQGNIKEEYQGMSYGEEIQEEKMLEEYLKKTLAASCWINVNLE